MSSSVPVPSLADDPPPLPPLPPDDNACCGNGCDPCVFDFYAQEREQYLADLRAWQARHPDAPLPKP